MKKYLLSCIALISFTYVYSQKPNYQHRAHEINNMFQRIHSILIKQEKTTKFYNKIKFKQDAYIGSVDNYEKYVEAFHKKSLPVLKSVTDLINFTAYRIRDIATLEDAMFHPTQINELTSFCNLLDNFTYYFSDFYNYFDYISKVPYEVEVEVAASLESLYQAIMKDYKNLYYYCDFSKGEGKNIINYFYDSTDRLASVAGSRKRSLQQQTNESIYF